MCFCSGYVLATLYPNVQGCFNCYSPNSVPKWKKSLYSQPELLLTEIITPKCFFVGKQHFPVGTENGKGHLVFELLFSLLLFIFEVLFLHEQVRERMPWRCLWFKSWRLNDNGVHDRNYTMMLYLALEVDVVQESKNLPALFSPSMRVVRLNILHFSWNYSSICISSLWRSGQALGILNLFLWCWYDLPRWALVEAGAFQLCREQSVRRGSQPLQHQRHLLWKPGEENKISGEIKK